MRYIEFITEARKNPESNPKISAISAISQYNNTASKLPNNMSNLFISLTEIDKLGINPNSVYNTPIGLYSYSADYALKAAPDTLEDLPFAGDSPYVNIFKIRNPDTIIYLNRVSGSAFRKYLSNLAEIVGKKAVSAAYSSASLNSEVLASGYGKLLWEITHIASKQFSNPPVAWNSIFRKMGVTGCIDTGEGIIHPSEPSQAVFFSLTSIEILDRVKNKYDKNTVEASKAVNAHAKASMSILKSLTTADEFAEFFNAADELGSYINIKFLKYIPIELKDEVLSKILPEAFFHYALQIVKDETPEYEKYILKSRWMASMYLPLRKSPKWPAAERLFASDPTYAVRYAEANRSAFPAGEAAIATDGRASMRYANVIKKPFPPGEPAIAESFFNSLMYATTILGGQRFPLGEPAILKNTETSFKYANEVIKGRWPAAEPNIAKIPHLAKEYDAIFGTNLSK